MIIAEGTDVLSSFLLKFRSLISTHVTIAAGVEAIEKHPS